MPNNKITYTNIEIIKGLEDLCFHIKVDDNLLITDVSKYENDHQYPMIIIEGKYNGTEMYFEIYTNSKSIIYRNL